MIIPGFRAHELRSTITVQSRSAICFGALLRQAIASGFKEPAEKSAG